MSRSVLFGYSVELDEGRIVISLSGSMASAVLNRMARPRDRWGRSGLPPLPLEWLGSAAVSLAPLLDQAGGEEIEEMQPAAEAGPDLKEIFGQGFDASYQDFEAKLVAYRELIASQEGGSRSSAAPTATADEGSAEFEAPSRRRSGAKGAASEG